MKVALCLYGYIGTLKGKTDDFSKKTDESSTGDLVLDLSHKHFKKHILDKNDVDVFIHSWEVDKQDEIKRLYEPKSSHFEKQIVFPDEPILDEWKRANVGAGDPKTPEGREKSKKRLQAHLSRWYGTGMSVQLKREYEERVATIDFLTHQDVHLAYRHLLSDLASPPEKSNGVEETTS